MRTLYLWIAAAAVMCIVHSASAELIIYKGTLKQSATGLGQSKKLNSQIYLVVDHGAGSFAAIQFVTVNGSKTFDVASETNSHIVQISGPKGKNIEAIVHPTDDESEGDTSEPVFLHGTDSTLTVNTGSTIVFPKILSGMDQQVSDSGGMIYIESTLMATFDGGQTLLSNGNGETLDQAVARISNLLEGQGYQKQSHEGRRSKHRLNFPGIDG